MLSKSLPPSLVLYAPDPIQAVLIGYPSRIRDELLSLVKTRCGLVADPKQKNRYVTPAALVPLPPAPISFVELGVRFTKTDNRWLEVASIAPASPARDEGLAVGDRVVLINGLPTEAMDESTARAEAYGPVGSLVTLEVARPEWQGTRELRVRMRSIT